MRRRRQKNPLLGKMIGLAVLINAILLPILASMGVFHPGHQHLQMVQLVALPKLQHKPPPPKPKVAKKQSRPHPENHVAKVGSERSVRPNPNAPKVVASASTGGNGDNSIDNSGNGKAGVVPVAPPTAPPPAATPPPPVTTPTPPPAPVAAPPVPTPQPPHVPVYAAAEVVKEVNPVIPDDFGVDQTPPPLKAVFTVMPDGTATVSDIESSGNPQLDSLVLDTVKHWTFKPATKDGVPVESYIRLKVEFDLS